MTTRHVIVYEGPQRTLVDRQTLAVLVQRSEHTIRARCPVAEHRQGRALYDLEQVVSVLATIPTRGRTP